MMTSGLCPIFRVFCLYPVEAFAVEQFERFPPALLRVAAWDVFSSYRFWHGRSSSWWNEASQRHATL